MLKAVKRLSMNATLLEVLQNANAVEILIRILDEQSSGPHSAVGFLLLIPIVDSEACIRKCLTTSLKHVIILVG
jgi:hypothetical protein